MSKNDKAAGVNGFGDTNTSGTNHGSNNEPSIKSSIRVYRLSRECFTNQPINLKAKATRAKGYRFKLEHPDTWARFIKAVSAHTANQRRWSMQGLFEDERRYHQVHCSHNVRSALARMICEEVDGAIDYVVLKESVFEKAREERMKANTGDTDGEGVANG